MKSGHKIILASALVFFTFGASYSHAADCKRIAFDFDNYWTDNGVGVEIKVKKVSILGNKGSWDENISNKKISYNDYHVTKQRRLNKLDDGEAGIFEVHFDYDQEDGGWESATYGPITITCNTGHAIPFKIEPN